MPWRVSLITFVYGPSGLNVKKVGKFLARDDELVSQLADYAEKTAKTEALIAELSVPDASPEALQSALQGFSSQFGLNAQIVRTAPTDQQARALFQSLNPAVASYDPLSTAPSASAAGQTARLATSVGELFFGTPVGLAAGGTALLLEPARSGVSELGISFVVFAAARGRWHRIMRQDRIDGGPYQSGLSVGAACAERPASGPFDWDGEFGPTDRKISGPDDGLRCRLEICRPGTRLEASPGLGQGNSH